MAGWFIGEVEVDHAPFQDEFTGVVYLITNLTNGRKYVGQKSFKKTIRRPPLKGKVRVRVAKVDNGFADYYGSSESLGADIERQGRESFKREIIRFCRSKSELNYFEMKELMDRDAILRADYYNHSVGCRVTRWVAKGFAYEGL